jgi:ABC-type polysaccharide/polyol phosphate export permease
MLLPAVWLVLCLFTLACTVLFAALGVLVRDVQHLLGVFMLLWFYLTPVFYDLERAPPDQARALLLNPMTVLVTAHRDVTLAGRSPDWQALLACAAFALVLLAAGAAFFRALEHRIIEEV